MLNQKWKERLTRPIKGPAVWWLVRIVVVITLITLPLAISASTSARYISAGTLNARARVATWSVRFKRDGWPARKTSITITTDPITGDTRAGMSPNGHPLVLFFEGVPAGTAAYNSAGMATVSLTKKNASFPIEFTNDSEVAARFYPKIDMTAPTATAAVDIVKGKIKFYDNVNDTAGVVYDGVTIPTAWSAIGTDITNAAHGVVLGPKTSRTVYVVIEPCTFTGLKLGAVAVQVD